MRADARAPADDAEHRAGDLGDLVDQQGCGKVYAALERCLERNDRNFGKCQPEVKRLKECYEKA